MLQWLRNLLQKRRERKAQRALAAFRNNYLLKFGLNKERDFALLNDIINQKVKHYVAVTSAIAKNSEQTDIVSSAKTMLDISKLVSTTVVEISDSYKNILYIYLGNLDNLVSYLTMEYNVIQHAVIEINKHKISQLKGKQIP